MASAWSFRDVERSHLDTFLAWDAQCPAADRHKRYQRIADQRYLYSQGSFRAEVAVDENGLVVDYQGVWESVTSS